MARRKNRQGGTEVAIRNPQVGGGRRARRRRGGGAGAGSMFSPVGLNAVCSPTQFVNPWSNFVGKKYPDAAASRTVAMRVRDRWTIGTSSDSLLRWTAVMPRLNAHSYRSPTYTAGPTWPITSVGSATAHNLYADLAALFAQVRVNSFGVRVICTSAPINTAGLLVIGVSADDNPADVLDPASPFVATDLSFAAGCDREFIAKPTNPRAHQFYPIESTDAPTTNNWEHVGIFVDAAADTSKFIIETVMDIELIPLANQVASRLATAGAADSPGFTGAVSSIYSGMSNFADHLSRAAQGTAAVARDASSIASSLALGYGSYAIGRRLVPQLGYR